MDFFLYSYALGISERNSGSDALHNVESILVIYEAERRAYAWYDG